MRKCKGRYYKSGKYHEFALGYFHQWGNNYVEFETGPGNFSTAIVELPDGEIIMPQADDIKFFKDEIKNDDLISRSALAEEIKSLRMYMTGLRAGKGFLIEFMEEYKKSVLKCIDEAPVAYDPDAVSDELIKKNFIANDINVPTNDGWIPVEERLPEKEGHYLVTFKTTKSVHMVGYGCCRRDVLGNPIAYGWYDIYSAIGFNKDAISAWQTLPEPYRQEGNRYDKK